MLAIHLDARHDLGGLKSFIDYTTRSQVITPSLSVNGVPGVTHGQCGAPRARTDGWFKKGDVLICLSLQSASFPAAKPTVEERAEHKAIIDSLKYILDFLSEQPPVLEGSR